MPAAEAHVGGAPRASDFVVPLDWRTSEDAPPLEAETGLIMLLILGVGFTVLTSLISILDRYVNGTTLGSTEHFHSAGRLMPPWLTASVIVAQWVWPATLLQSCTVAWRFGVAGAFWYAAGAAVQICVFAHLALEMKTSAPEAHTYLEVVRARWGARAHTVFVGYALTTHVIVSAMLMLGGAAVVRALTGVPAWLASCLLSWGVVTYTLAGGLRTSFFAAYVHTAGLFSFVLVVLLAVFAGSTAAGLGDASQLYARLQANAALPAPDASERARGFHCGPVIGNRAGSHVTMRSVEGLSFGVINLVGNFATVFLDQSYWQVAVAADGRSVHKAFVIASALWFAVPFATATALGLSATALNVRLTPEEASAGLVAPAVMVALLGQPGAALVVCAVSLAIMSTGAAECNAVASLLTFDIYAVHFKSWVLKQPPQLAARAPAGPADAARAPDDAPGARPADERAAAISPQRAILAARGGVAAFGVVMALAAIALDAIGLSLSFVYQFMGVLIGPAVVPIALCFYWPAADGDCATAAALVGTAVALVAWLAVAATSNGGTVSVATLGQSTPMLVGNVVALAFSPLVMAVGSRRRAPRSAAYTAQLERAPETAAEPTPRADDGSTTVRIPTAQLLDARAWLRASVPRVVACTLLGVPALTVTWGVFTESLFVLWTSAAFCAALAAATIAVVMPLVESSGQLQIMLDRATKRVAKRRGQKSAEHRASQTSVLHSDVGIQLGLVWQSRLTMRSSEARRTKRPTGVPPELPSGGRSGGDHPSLLAGLPSVALAGGGLGGLHSSSAAPHMYQA